MEQLILTSKHDEIGVIAINNPPVNALSSGVLRGIKEAVYALEQDAAVRVIVVIGSGRTFPAGADLNQFVEFVAGRGGACSLLQTLFA